MYIIQTCMYMFILLHTRFELYKHHLEPLFSVYAWHMPVIYHVYVDLPHMPGIYIVYPWIYHVYPCISIRLDIHGTSLDILAYTMYIYQVYTLYIHGYTWYIIDVYTWYICGI
jgi:hypothetical protein